MSVLGRIAGYDPQLAFRIGEGSGPDVSRRMWNGRNKKCWSRWCFCFGVS